MGMDAAEHNLFAGCADGSIYQVELFRRVRKSIFSVSKLVLSQLYATDVLFVIQKNAFTSRTFCQKVNINQH